jgi:hypothetical protein
VKEEYIDFSRNRKLKIFEGGVWITIRAAAVSGKSTARISARTCMSFL